MDLSVIIVTYNDTVYLEHTLDSLHEALSAITHEIVIVDNSSLGSVNEIVVSNHPSVIYIPSGGNLGFAKANNLGFSLSTGKLILVLNPDTIITQSAILSCMGKVDSGIGAIGVNMIDGSGKYLPESNRNLPSFVGSILKIFGLSDRKYYASSERTDVLSGAFMLLRRSVAEQMGGILFDERYFMYGEDIDTSRQLLEMGYENLVNQDEVIIHFKGESTSNKSHKAATAFYESMKLYFEKYNPRSVIRKKLIELAIPFLIRKRMSPSVEQEDSTLQVYKAYKSISTELTQKLQRNGILQDESSTNILFDMSMVSYADVVGFVHQHKSAYSYYFANKRNTTILCSPNKNHQGAVIHL